MRSPLRGFIGASGFYLDTFSRAMYVTLFTKKEFREAFFYSRLNADLSCAI